MILSSLIGGFIFLFLIFFIIAGSIVIYLIISLYEKKRTQPFIPNDLKKSYLNQRPKSDFLLISGVLNTFLGLLWLSMLFLAVREEISSQAFFSIILETIYLFTALTAFLGLLLLRRKKSTMLFFFCIIVNAIVDFFTLSIIIFLMV